MAQINVLPTLSLGVADSYNDMNSLSIIDLSQYSSLPTSDQLAMQITPPGGETINVAFTPGTINVYKCIDLGLTCSTPDCCPLLDGVYGVRYTVAMVPTIVGGAVYTIDSMGPFVIEKTFLRVDNLRCKWMNAFLKVDLECDCKDEEQKKYKEELKRIDLLITGCIVANNNCDPALSSRLYDKANSMLDLLCCKFNMPCSDITCNSCGCH